MADSINFSRPNSSLSFFWSAIFVLAVSHIGSVVSHFGSVAWAADEKPIGTIIGIIGTVQMKTGGEPEPVAKKSTPGKLQIKPVSFEPDSAWQAAKFKQEVYASDNFRTKRGSRLKIKFNDNSLLALGPNSRMSIGSYQLNKSQKFRKGVINVAKGLSMYIINKSQKNKDSSFKVVTPTANLSSRGTFGFISSSPTKTIVANKTGAMSASNVDPNVAGSQLVGANSVSTIPQGQAPTVPQTMSNNNFNSISTVVLGRIGTSLPSSMFKQDSGSSQQSTSQSDSSSDSSDSSSSSSSSSDSSSSDSSSNSDSSSQSSTSNAGGGDSIVSDFVSVAGPDIAVAFNTPVNVPFAAVAAGCTP
jgi:hypothetical protein